MPHIESTDSSFRHAASAHHVNLAPEIPQTAIGGIRLRAAAALKVVAFRRRKIVIPLLVLSLGSYLITLLAFAYFPDTTSQILTGSINVAYALALMQFVVTFAVALMYSAMVAKWVDPVTEDARMLYVQLGSRGQDD